MPGELTGLRLDRAAAVLFPEYSRGRLQGWIRDGELRLDGRVVRPRQPVAEGERIEVRAAMVVDSGPAAEDLPLNILHEDEEILVLDKPAGWVVHPAVGNRSGTLLNALLHHLPILAALPRAGIVHRLDKDTTGLMVVAKTLTAHKALVEQIRVRSLGREYDALVWGVPTGGGRVDAPLGRHPHRRTRMAVQSAGRPAVTNYRVSERFAAHSVLRVLLETGRTHQIRVHLAHIGHPLVGDPVYCGRARHPRGGSAELRSALASFRRQALHARVLTLEHPGTAATMTFEAMQPADLAALLAVLRAEQGGEG